jgi:Sulfatase
MKLRTWLQGAGVAAIVLFPFYRSLLDRAGEVRMHAPASVAGWALSLVTNLVVVSLFFALLGAWLRSTSWVRWFRLLIPAFVLASVVEVIQVARTGWVTTDLWLTVWFVTIFFSLLLHWHWRTGEQLLFQLSQAILVGVGFFCIFVVFRLLHFAMWRQMPNSTDDKIPVALSHTDRPRTIWILFDELSYQQVFGDRYADLELPNFDELRRTSTLFTDVQPILDSTEHVIPSILLGEVAQQIDYTTKDRLEVGGAAGPLHPFDAARTPFATARQLELTTGVVGWYNPYCPILAPYLNQCYWTDALRTPRVSEQKSFWKNVWHPWSLYGAVFIHARRMFSRNYREHFIEDFMMPMDVATILDADNQIFVYQDLMGRAARMLGPSGPNLVFLHLPLPHDPDFYNRKTLQFDASGFRSYVDNLALTDKTLGQFLAILRQSPQWKNTNVIVCGDHSWRVYLSRGNRYWTPEDEAASHGGVFDPRPFLMVHVAGQTTPATVSEPFPLLRVHDILNDLVTGKQPTLHEH